MSRDDLTKAQVLVRELVEEKAKHALTFRGMSEDPDLLSKEPFVGASDLTTLTVASAQLKAAGIADRLDEDGRLLKLMGDMLAGASVAMGWDRQ